MADEEYMKEKYTEMQMLDEQIRHVQQQIQQLDEQMSQVIVTKQALVDLDNMKVGTEMLVPVSNGIFAKSELKNKTNLLVNVGGNVVTEKSVADTKKLMDDQMDEISKYRAQMLAQVQILTMNIKDIEEDLKKGMKDVQVS